MNIAIVGSRDYGALEHVRAYVRTQLADGDVVVSGGARGVDRTAESEARRRGLRVLIFPAEWEKYGRGAGMRRNHAIVDAADMVVVFWDGVSRGSAATADMAIAAGKPTRIIQLPPYPVGEYNMPEAGRGC